MSEDKELDLLTARKAREMRRRLAQKKTPPPPQTPLIDPDRQLVVSRLGDRGLEVLQLAEKSYPHETAKIIKRIADLFRQGVLGGRVTGGELLWVFRRLGINIHIETSVTVQDKGKFVSLAEKMKSNYD